MKKIFLCIIAFVLLSVCYAQDERREIEITTVNAAVYVNLEGNAKYDFMCSEIIMDDLIQRNRYAGSSICVVYVFYPYDGYTWCIPFRNVKNAAKFIAIYRIITEPCVNDKSKETIANVNSKLTDWFNSMDITIGHTYDTNSKGEPYKIRYCKSVRW